MTDDEKRQTFRRIRFLLEEDARKAGVPFWNRDRLFSELCKAHLEYLDMVTRVASCVVSPNDFIPMSVRATSVPMLRPHGASDERVMALAQTIQMHVCLLLSDMDGLPIERQGDRFRFGIAAGAEERTPIRVA